MTVGISVPEQEELRRGLELGLGEGATAASLLETDLVRAEGRGSAEDAGVRIATEAGGNVVTISPLPGGGDGTYRVLPDASTRLVLLGHWSVAQELNRWEVDPSLRPFLEQRLDGAILTSGNAAPDVRVTGSSERWTAVRISGDEPVTLNVLAWHPQLFRFGATQLNQRYERRYGSGMSELAWSGWFSAKLAVDALLRNDGHPEHEWLSSGVFDGQKGAGLYFDADRTLIQPMYLVQGSGTPEIEELPMEEHA